MVESSSGRVLYLDDGGIFMAMEFDFGFEIERIFTEEQWNADLYHYYRIITISHCRC